MSKYARMRVTLGGVRQPVRLAKFAAGLIAFSAVLGTGGLGPQSASAAVNHLYAYAGGIGTAPAGCVKSRSSVFECSLAEALKSAHSGDTIYLAGEAAGASTPDYTGNWSVKTPSTGAPLTIEALPGTTATLDGSAGTANPCETSACTSSILSITNHARVNLHGITFTGGHATFGAAINNEGHSTLIVDDCTFTVNVASDDGGAIANGVHSGTGTLTVIGSSFTSNLAKGYGGGAIDNGEYDGNGTLSITNSSFSANSAKADGGAIDSGDDSGTGNVTIADSSFASNGSGYDGGAIDSGDNSGTAKLTVTGSTFTFNVGGGGSGGAIDNGDGVIWEGTNPATGTLSVADSTFTANSATDGGAIENGGGPGTGTLTVTGSTFAFNTVTDPAGDGGPVIDNSRGGSGGTVNAAADVFAGSCDQGDGTGGGAWTDAGYNVGTDGSCEIGGTGDSTSMTVTELGPLTYDGGPTATVNLLAGNPAISLIPAPTQVELGGTQVQLCARLDQRGIHSRGNCSAGAVEYATGPQITARLSSARPETSFGWYPEPVTVTFACAANGTTLSVVCPTPVTVTQSGRGETVTRTIITTAGVQATATVHVNIDRTTPKLTILGLHPGATYTHLPKVACSARDPLSGIVSCTLSRSVGPRTAGGARTVVYTATAVNRAGVSVEKSNAVRVL